MYQYSPLKWAGSKYRCLDDLFKTIPQSGNVFIEPFVGSATVALNTDYKHYVLCDLNKDLITAYKYIVQDVEALINDTETLFTQENTTKEAYYTLRERFNNSQDDWEKTTLFLYLNRHCFNGLMRYNKGKGTFNTSAGSYKAPILPVEALRFFSTKFKNAEFKHSSFSELSLRIKKGTNIFIDPPYISSPTSKSFTEYTPSGFSLAEHVELDRLAKVWAKRNANVFLSNSDTELTIATYKNAKHVKRFNVQRVISCNGAERNLAAEVLLSY